MSRCALAHDQDGALWPELHHGRCGLVEVGQYLGLSRSTVGKMAVAGRLGALREADGLWMDKGATGKGKGIIRCCPARLWRSRGLGRYAAFSGFNPQSHGPRHLYWSTWESIQAMRARLTGAGHQAESSDPAMRPTTDLMGEIVLRLASSHNEILALVRRASPTVATEFPHLAAAH